MISAVDFFKNISKLSMQDLMEIKGVGEVIAQNFEDFKNSNRYIHLIEKFQILEEKNRFLEITVKPKSNLRSDLPFIGEVICITGTFDISRNEIKEKLEAKGAKVVDTVTSKTTILLAGQNSGSKLEKANKLNVNIVNNLESVL